MIDRSFFTINTLSLRRGCVKECENVNCDSYTAITNSGQWAYESCALTD
jgi:hypothetical protein